MLMTDKHFDQKNLIFLAMAKYLSGFASYIYDVGIVIYLFSNTQSVGIVGGFFCITASAGNYYFIYRKSD